MWKTYGKRGKTKISLPLDLLGDFGDESIQNRVRQKLGLDHIHVGMNRRVVSVKEQADLGEGQTRKRPNDVHGNVAGVFDFFFSGVKT